MSIATVTLTYNRLPALKRCIDTIREGGPEQIVVVDNHTTDGTAAWLAEQGDIWSIRLPENRGVIARNHGFDLVRPHIDVVVQIDDDVEMRGGWRSRILKPFDDPKVVATGQLGGYTGDYTSLVPANGLAPGTYVDTVMGFCWAIAKNRITTYIGYGIVIDWPDCRYDEEFGMRWHEESDLQCWLRLATGKKIATCEPCATHHSQAGPVDWELHNRNLERLRTKWANLLKSERA